MPMTKVLVYIPGTTVFCSEVELDTSKRIHDMYYKGAEEADMIPIAYCYGIKHKATVCGMMRLIEREESEMRNRHAKILTMLRKQYGI